MNRTNMIHIGIYICLVVGAVVMLASYEALRADYNQLDADFNELLHENYLNFARWASCEYDLRECTARDWNEAIWMMATVKIECPDDGKATRVNGPWPGDAYAEGD